MICALDRDAALAMKHRLRCGWQTVAQAMGFSVIDLRRACDPMFADDLPRRRAGVRSAPPPKPMPRKARARVSPVLTTMLAARATPQGAFLSAGTLGLAAGIEHKAMVYTLGQLLEQSPPLVERYRRNNTCAFGWRLTVAGFEAASDAGEGGR
jgi:hypothetical protein